MKRMHWIGLLVCSATLALAGCHSGSSDQGSGQSNDGSKTTTTSSVTSQSTQQQTASMPTTAKGTQYALNTTQQKSSNALPADMGASSTTAMPAQAAAQPSPQEKAAADKMRAQLEQLKAKVTSQGKPADGLPQAAMPKPSKKTSSHAPQPAKGSQMQSMMPSAQPASSSDDAGSQQAS